MRNQNMSDIQIKTLTQIHIGNGSFLQQGNDFLVVARGEDSFIYVLDIDKLGEIVGTDEETIRQWVKAVERNDTENFVKERTKGICYKDFSKREILNYADISCANGTLKECMHDGLGRPYIPGSSIKGAIRTAVMAFLARQRVVEELEGCKGSGEQKKVLLNMEKKVLGAKPEEDLFRYLCTGDAYFDKGSEIAVKQINLNIRQKGGLIDQSKQQAVEAIGPNNTSNFRMNIKDCFYDRIGISDETALFELMNEHTRALVESEIDYWESRGEDAALYVENMGEMLEEINSCLPCECVLRMGQAIGWRFITGAWAEVVDSAIFNQVVVPMSRPKNEKLYKSYGFPKTRRMDDESYLFGFVKLTVK